MNKDARFSFNDINFLSRSFQQSRVFLSGFELGIFTVLGEEKKSSNQIAEEIKTDPRATDRFLNALCVTGAIKKKNDLFCNSEAAKQYLVEGKPEYQGGLLHSVNLWDSWSNLTESVKTGRSVNINPVAERDDKWFKPFIAAMHSRAFNEAPSLIAQIDLTGVKKVLDVGGGSAAFSMAFVNAGDDAVLDAPLGNIHQNRILVTGTTRMPSVR